MHTTLKQKLLFMSLKLPQNCVMHNCKESDMKGRLLQKTEWFNSPVETRVKYARKAKKTKKQNGKSADICGVALKKMQTEEIIFFSQVMYLRYLSCS